MNKNDLTRTIKVLNSKKGRPISQTKVITNSSNEGTKAGETRATFIVKETLLAKIKGIAYWDRLDIKQVVNEAMEAAVAKYEKSNGDIKPVPAKNSRESRN